GGGNGGGAGGVGVVVLRFLWKPRASRGAQSGGKSETASALRSHRRSRRSGELIRICPIPMPKCGSLVSLKLHSMLHRLEYFFSRPRAFSSPRLVARHHACFLSFSCTQTTAPTG